MQWSRRTDAGRRNLLLVKVLTGLIVTGAVIGVFVGMVSATVLEAVGIRATDPTPTAAASAGPTSAPTSAATSAPPTTEAPPPPDPQPRIEADPAEASPGERVTLTGIFPDLDGGTSLQVERREKGGDWQDFPVNARTQDDGTFSTYVQTSRTGAQEFRLTAGRSSTPAVTVTIG